MYRPPSSNESPTVPDRATDGRAYYSRGRRSHFLATSTGRAKRRHGVRLNRRVKCEHCRPRFSYRTSIPACAIRLNVEDERTLSDLACDSRSRARWTRAAINADRIGTTKGSMRKLIVSEFISLDGVIQAPG